MATAKRQASGAYRVRVYSHTENGKKKYESFTAPSKREAELKASEWLNQRDRHKTYNMTVKEALEGYIKAKEGVLSPSTIRGYNKMLNNNFNSIKSKNIKKITSEDLQVFISDLSKELSPKTVRNVYALLSSALALYMPNITFRVTLPKMNAVRPVSPDDKKVKELFEMASPELKKCIALGAYAGLRRGEICALTYSDLKDGVIFVNKDMVQSTNNKWVVKEMPKTSESIRQKRLPQKVVKLLGTGKPDEKIISYSNPGSITQCFTKLRNRIGINVRFHDLRHYFASIGAVLGIPDTYLSDFGGWKRGSSVMKEVYQNNMASKTDYYSDKMNKHFDKMIKKV